MFQRCVAAQLSKDFAHSKMYANECAEIRKMARITIASQLALERVVLRLETVEEFGDVMVQIAPVMGIVQETKQRVQGVVPEVASELEEVNSVLGDLSTEAGQVSGKEFDLEASDDDARQVLQESSAIAEQKMREEFPHLPQVEGFSENSAPLEKIPIEVFEDRHDLTDKVVQYLREHEGELSVTDCANRVGARPDDVRQVITRLQDEGKIILE